MTNRRTLLAGTALAATLGIAGWTAPAMAQGFSGTGTVVGGTAATIAPGNADITLNQSEAIINWNVTGASPDVTFLPLANTVSFHEAAVSFVGTDYTVLNRVFPVDVNGNPISATVNIGGTVNSTFAGKQGGNVWFYSPHGIITSGSATFNVGSLLLSASDIDTSSGSLYFTPNQIKFNAASDSNALIQIGSKTTISALGNNTSSIAGYVGIFAPRIEQGGSVRAGGMVGYAAGEAGTMTFNAGLVDIAITQGSAESGGNGIVHTGTTGGPAVTATTTRQIKMVAMPKNTALTMLLGGSIGFDAGTAVPDGAAVVLSSGWQPTSTPAEIAQGLGNIQIGNATISGDPTVYATATLAIAPDATTTGLTRFNGLTQFNVGRSLTMDAAAGTLVDFTGNLVVSPLRQGTGENVRITTAGDPLNILAPGKIAVASDLFIDATGQTFGALAAPPVTGADGVGGNVQVLVNKGSLTIGGDFSITADGIGQDATQSGGNGIGGSIDVRVSGGGSITGAPATPPATVLPVPVSFTANGVAGSASGAGSTGGTGTGGVITLQDNGGALGFGGVNLVANGSGSTSDGTGALLGDGLGGQISVTVAGQAQTWDTLSVDASAINAASFSSFAGNAIGNLGGAKLQVTGPGQLTLTDLTLLNEAQINGGNTGTSNATAGGVDLLVNAGGKLTVTGTTILDASAFSGNQSLGGAMTGGTANATVDGTGSTWTVGDLSVAAEANRVGSAVTGSGATGGQVAVGATNGGLLTVVPNGVRPTLVFITAASHLGYGPAVNTSQGGTARLYVLDGKIDATGIDLNVSAAGMADGVPYDGADVGLTAIGGTASLQLLAGGLGLGSITAANIAVNAKGEAVRVLNADPYHDFTGNLDSSNVTPVDAPGNGQGGTAQLLIQSGTLTAGVLQVHASGLGGSASYNGITTPWQSGNGTGGQALANQSGGTASLVTLDLLAQGRGGSFTDPLATFGLAPLAGNGFGGTARATFSRGSMTTSRLFVAATALGGDGTRATINAASSTSTAGGFADASLSLAELLMPNGSTANLTVTNTTRIDATATGGSGLTGSAPTNGGAAIAGTARASLADGAFSLGIANVLASAQGGNGGNGGSGTGGTAAFLLVDTLATPAITRQATGGLVLLGTGFGGTGSIADGIATPGTTKLTVRAANAASALVANGFYAEAKGVSIPGDGFTGNFGAVPFQVNVDFQVNTTRDINMTVDAGGGVNAGRSILLNSSRAITTTGTGVLFGAGGARVTANNLINMGALSSGATTLLVAFDPVTGLRGPVTVQSLSSVGAVDVEGSTVTLTSPGSLTFNSAAAFGGNLTINTAQNLTMGGTSTTGTAGLTAGGNLALNGTASATQGFALQAGGNITTASVLTTLGSYSAVAGGTYTGALPLNVPGNVSIDAAGGITIPSLTTAGGNFLPSITSGGTTFLRSVNAPISLSLTSTGAVTLAGRSATITSPGALTFANATTTAGDLFITTGGALTLGGATSSGVLSLTAPALVTINGAVAGQTIRISSPDIAISATGRLGQRGLTNTILLTNTAPTRGTQIGGTGQQGVWSLDAAEAARLFAEQEIAILPGATAQGVPPGTVTVGALALTYGTGTTPNLGSGGQFVVSTPGAILVNGQVALGTSTNADTLFLSGGTIDVVTDTGGIALTGTGGTLLGTLDLNADAIRVGTASALSALSGITAVDTASTRLGANDGLVNQAGTIRTGALTVTFNTRFFIQNSGSSTQIDLRRGFAANTLAITIGSASAQIAINGVAGSLAGLTQRNTRINGALAATGGPFDPLSTINGCVIGRDCGTTPPGQIVPPLETIEGLVGPLGPPPSGLLVLPVIQFGDMPLFDSPPLIDEPVTGVGNDDLWQQR